MDTEKVEKVEKRLKELEEELYPLTDDKLKELQFVIYEDICFAQENEDWGDYQYSALLYNRVVDLRNELKKSSIGN